MVSWPWPGIFPPLINLWLTIRGLALRGLEYHANKAKVTLYPYQADIAGRCALSHGLGLPPLPMQQGLGAGRGGLRVRENVCGCLSAPSPWRA